MTNNKLYYTALGTMCFVFAHAEGECKESERPNVIFILADDLGYGDLSVYNPAGKIKTPVLDSLAEVGIRFTNAHSSASVSSPTRYGLMTGRYPCRSRLKKGVLWTWADPLLGDELTLPQMMRNNGYATALIGKWHLGIEFATKDGAPVDKKGNGSNVDYTKRICDGPTHHGFDYYYGDDVPNFPPYVFIHNDRFTEIPDRQFPESGMPGVPGVMSESWLPEKLLPIQTDKAIEYIRGNKEKPFFMMVSLTAPHTPIAPNREFVGVSSAGRYGDFVQEMDYRIGLILASLRDEGISDNTIVIFSSDNGSSFQDGGSDGGERYGGKFGSILNYGHNPSGQYRGMKSDSWEGGHRIPFIVSLPEGVCADVMQRNGNNDELVCDLDIFATLADILDYATPSDEAFDSRSLLPTLKGTCARKNLVVQSGNGVLSYLSGRWKLIAGSGSGGSLNPFAASGELPQLDSLSNRWRNVQLFDMKKDPRERHNVARKRYHITRRLMSELANNVVPTPDSELWQEVMWTQQF